MTDWQPIYNAPKDGTRVLGFVDGEWSDPASAMDIIYWSKDIYGSGWFTEYLDRDGDWIRAENVIAWMPLPAPPKG